MHVYFSFGQLKVSFFPLLQSPHCTKCEENNICFVENNVLVTGWYFECVHGENKSISCEIQYFIILISGKGNKRQKMLLVVILKHLSITEL